MIEASGSRKELENRLYRVLDGEAPFGLVVVFDENGMIDFGLRVTTVQVRDGILEYARDLAAYHGDTPSDRKDGSVTEFDFSEQTISMKSYNAIVPVVHGMYPEWRYGQTLFNVLYQMQPDLANEIRATELDPFHVDSVAPAFLEWLSSRVPAE